MTKELDEALDGLRDMPEEIWIKGTVMYEVNHDYTKVWDGTTKFIRADLVKE